MITSYLETMNDITISTNRDVYETIDLRPRKNAFWQWLKEKGRIRSITGGRAIENILEVSDDRNVALLSDTNEDGSLSGYDVITTERTNDLCLSVWKWVTIKNSVVISDTELTNNSGKEALVSLVMVKQKSLKTGIDKKKQLLMMGQATMPNSLWGLKNLVADIPDVGFVGELDASQNPEWQNKAYAPTTPITEDNIARMMDVVSDQLDEYDAIWMSKTAYNMFKNSERSKQVFIQSAIGDLGFPKISYEGIPIYCMDKGHQGYLGEIIPQTVYPDNEFRIYFLNSEDLEVIVIGGDDGFSETGWEKPTARLVAINTMVWKGQFIVNNRSNLGVLTQG